MQMFEIQRAKLSNGKTPFDIWFLKLDKRTKAVVAKRLENLKLGLMGDCKNLGDGVFELRFFIGPGYRVYFGIEQNKIVILLTGGDKKSQKSDIRKAKDLWLKLKR